MSSVASEDKNNERQVSILATGASVGSAAATWGFVMMED